MKRLFCVIRVIVGLVLPFGLCAQQKSISLDKALSIVQSHYENHCDVDFYWLSDRTDHWGIFVDENPCANWAHECSIYTFSNTGYEDVDTIPVIQHYMLPPNETMELVSVSHSASTRGLGVNVPIMTPSFMIKPDLNVAAKTYAIIINGGYYASQNHIRYWKDCSMIYQTLVKTYKVPRSNIDVLIADGTDPRNDMRLLNGSYISSPLDLDLDGLNDIEYAATEENIAYVLSELEVKLKKEDHLFVFMIGHGVGFDSANSVSNFLVWGEDANAIANHRRLFDYELAEMLDGIVANGVNVNVVAGQCYAGGFIDDLEDIGCVVTTASAADEPSYAMTSSNNSLNLQFDEFMYHWTSAMNGFDTLGNYIDADTDNNGSVSMVEAFMYAKLNDQFYGSNSQNKHETPQYASNPLSLGEDLAFNHLPKALDLYIKDRFDDNGVEHIQLPKYFWQSPSIWVRNSEDDEEAHENPHCTSDDRMVYVYVKIHNRGRDDYTGGTKWLHVNWGQSSPGVTIKSWKGSEIFNEYPTGGSLSPIVIPTIESGDSTIVKVPWELPSYIMQQNSDSNICYVVLLARILDTSTVTPYEFEFPTWYDVIGENDYAQKSVSIINRRQTAYHIPFYVRNMSDGEALYSLELRAQSSKDTTIFKRANVELTFSPSILDAWEACGNQGEHIEYIPADNPLKVKMLSDGSLLREICLQENQLDTMTIKFDFYESSLPDTYYKLDLILRDEDEYIVGGQTYIVEAPRSVVVGPGVITPVFPEPFDSIFGSEIHLDAQLDGTELLSEWTDASGKIVGRTPTIKVKPSSRDDKYFLRVLTNDGDLYNNDITLSPTLGIKSVICSSIEKSIDVELLNVSNSSESYILLQSLGVSNEVRKYAISPMSKDVKINAYDVPPGLYVVSYVVDGVVVDTYKFIK